MSENENNCRQGSYKVHIAGLGGSCATPFQVSSVRVHVFLLFVLPRKYVFLPSLKYTARAFCRGRNALWAKGNTDDAIYAILLLFLFTPWSPLPM